MYPWDGGKGPTMSIWTTSKRAFGVGKEESEAEECLCTLARWHCMHDRAQRRTSELIPGQTNREVINFWAGWIPGWERPWRDLKTVRRQGNGTSGR